MEKVDQKRKEITFIVGNTLLDWKKIAASQIKNLKELKPPADSPYGELYTELNSSIIAEVEKVYSALNPETLSHLGTAMATVHTRADLERFISRLKALQIKS